MQMVAVWNDGIALRDYGSGVLIAVVGILEIAFEELISVISLFAG